ncbi:hypothetical protein C8Q76DRAFT_819788 [Earliella scabrosa]|nr:hypothetical protein C8Q76DRAFT_819788 [Earliella scabrosa]
MARVRAPPKTSVAPRRAGRKKKVFKGRAAVKRKREAAEALARAQRRSTTPKTDGPSDKEETIEVQSLTTPRPLEGDAAMRIQLLTAPRLADFEQPPDPRRIPDFLGPPKVDPTWRHHADVPTHEVYRWFDAQLNDYLCHTLKRSRAVKITWIGHPGDSPLDARGRTFVVRRDPNSGISISEWEKACLMHRPVLRWVYLCGGVHDLEADDEVSQEGGDGADDTSVAGLANGDEEAEGQGEEESDTENDPLGEGGDGAEERNEEEGGLTEVIREHRKRWQACANGVKLRLEICADDLSTVHIYMRNDHPDADRSQIPYLMHSRHLRLQVSVVKKGLQAMFDAARPDPTARNALYAEMPNVYVPPLHRRPRGKQIGNMLKMPAISIAHTGELTRRQWMRSSTDDGRSYTQHNPKLPDALSPFTIALTDDFSMDSLILHGATRGWALDSSWRNKNENRAAVTFLIAVNAEGHAVPGAVFLSANTRSDTLQKFLLATKQKLLTRAITITKGTGKVESRPPADLAVLIQNAQRMVDSDYTTSHFMIDKCQAELDAIRKVYPGRRVRLCQFHVVQAITRFDCDNGDRGAPMRIGVEIKAKIIYHFRILQRCRNELDWEASLHTFLSQVERAIMTQRTAPKNSDPPAVTPPDEVTRYRAQYEFVRAYFINNWFTAEWIETFTDMGLPADGTRDGTWNTNNFIERSFQTFDQIFLESRKNKRLDRLATIILHDFFPYFQYWGPDERAMPIEQRKLNALAHQLWEDDLVEVQPDESFVIHCPPGGRGADFGNSTDKQPGVTLPRVTLLPPMCPCSAFQQTGKACAHLKAAALYTTNGPISEWHAEESNSERRRLRPSRVRKKDLGLAREKKMCADNFYDKQVNDIYQHLEEEEARAAKEAEERAHRRDWIGEEGDFAVSPGRPSNVRPMLPHRTPRKTRMAATPDATTPTKSRPAQKPVIFSRKRGRKGQERLASNSLLPNSQAVRDAMREARGSALQGVPTGSSDERAWEREEASIRAMDFSRWESDSYTLRKEEYALYVDVINHSTLARETGLIMWFAPDTYLAKLIEATDLSGDGFTALLRHHGQTKFADLISSRPEGVARIVFPHLDVEAMHWTLHEHDLRGGGHVVTTWDSLSGTSPIAMEDQLAVARALFRSGWIRHGESGNERAADDLAIDPQLRHAVPQVRMRGTGLQTDSASCGFWSVMFAWAILLDIDISRAAFRAMTVEEIKDILEEIWRSWIEPERGLPTELVADLFDMLEPGVAWESLSHVFAAADPAITSSPCASDAAQPIGDQGGSPAPTQLRTLRLREPSILERADLRKRLEDVLAGRDKSTWTVAGEDFEQITVENLLGGQAVSNYLLDAVIRLVLEDLREGVWDIAFGSPPGGDAPDPHRVYVNTWLDSFYLAKADGVNGEGGIAPPRKTNARWYTKIDIFAMDMLVIPYFWKEAHHWVCAVVDMRERTIAVYDSLKEPRRRKALYRRVYKMLQYEWAALRNGELGDEGWRSEAPPYRDLPLQGDTLHCAIYALTFALERVCGRHPDNGSFTFSGTEANIRRHAMALRLVAALPNTLPTVVWPSSAPNQVNETPNRATKEDGSNGSGSAADRRAVLLGGPGSAAALAAQPVSGVPVDVAGTTSQNNNTTTEERDGNDVCAPRRAATKAAPVGVSAPGVVWRSSEPYEVGVARGEMTKSQPNANGTSGRATAGATSGAENTGSARSSKQEQLASESDTSHDNAGPTAGAHFSEMTRELAEVNVAGDVMLTRESVERDMSRTERNGGASSHTSPSSEGPECNAAAPGVDPEGGCIELAGALTSNSPKLGNHMREDSTPASQPRIHPSNEITGERSDANEDDGSPKRLPGSGGDDDAAATSPTQSPTTHQRNGETSPTATATQQGHTRAANTMKPPQSPEPRARSLSVSAVDPPASTIAAVVKAKARRKSAPLEALERAMLDIQRLEARTQELCSRPKVGQSNTTPVPTARMDSIPAVGDWEMLIWKKTVVARCPYRAFPAEVTAVDLTGGWVTLQPDPALMMLDEPGRAYDAARLQQVLQKARRVKWSEYHMQIHGIGRHEVAPMIWPADLERRGNATGYAAARTNERQRIRDHLQDMLPGMAQVLTEGGRGRGTFADLIAEGLQSQGEVVSGRKWSGSATGGMWEFFMSRTSQPEKVDEEYVPILDAVDEATVVEMADRLRRQLDSPAGPDDLHLKTATAGRVYLAYGALSVYTGLAQTEVAGAVAAGRIRRPETRWERAWRAYSKVSGLNLRDTHRIVFPGLEVPVPELAGANSDQGAGQ